MDLNQLFDLSLVGRREEIALEFRGETYTFGEIDRRANRMANVLSSRGLMMGDRLSVYLANRMEFLDLYLACVRLGVIFNPINILYRDREITHILHDAEPKAVVSETVLPYETWHPEELLREAETASSERPVVMLDGDTPAAIIYTSGTTGTSKGAVLTHNNFASNAISLLACWQISSSDRFLLPLPLFHVHGLGNGVHCWLMSGCLMRLLERFEHAKAAAEFLDFQPTLFFAVPTIYVRLLDVAPDSAQVIGSRMRLFVSGSAPLPPHVLEQFRTLYGHTILERYGMSETMMNISNPYVGERRAGTVGFPMPGVSVKIDETGELWVRGPNVFAGYWRREDATKAAFQDGWFRTGDLGVRSEDGYYTLQGRRSDLIISGGFNIYPREIEEFLLEQPEVKEAAVVGMPDRVRGEVPVAYIVPREAAFDAEVIEQRCRAALASFKVPRAFVRIDSLPRTALGKVQKHLLPSR
ncbi:MAG: AMP-binding protein [Bryobacteraceae bacterium]